MICFEGYLTTFQTTFSTVIFTITLYLWSSTNETDYWYFKTVSDLVLMTMRHSLHEVGGKE